jgi:hypothetical protein
MIYSLHTELHATNISSFLSFNLFHLSNFIELYFYFFIFLLIQHLRVIPCFNLGADCYKNTAIGSNTPIDVIDASKCFSSVQESKHSNTGERNPIKLDNSPNLKHFSYLEYSAMDYYALILFVGLCNSINLSIRARYTSQYPFSQHLIPRFSCYVMALLFPYN